jgi:energy-coupling factor transporter ATP-binding protein EcfA2
MPLNEFYISRQDLVNDLYSHLQKHGRVLLAGEAGSGKSVLTELLIAEAANYYEIIHQFTGMELEISKGARITVPRSTSGRRALMIVDRLDEIISADVREKLFDLSQRASGYALDFLFVSRSSDDFPEYTNSSFVYKMPLFSGREVVELLNLKGLDYAINRVVLQEIGELTRNNPLLISLIFDLRRDGIDIDTISSLLKTDINYKNDLLVKLGPPPTVLFGNPPQLITDVHVVNKSLIEKVKRDPRGIHGITPREFEELVAELFQKEGYTVDVTKQTHDGGKDLFIIENRRVGKFIYYVECKRNAPDRPVGVNIIRELYGTVMADRVTAGIVVTSSYFSDSAKVFTEKVSHQISLRDYVDLNEWIRGIENK